jgi:hypothetical protein
MASFCFLIFFSSNSKLADTALPLDRQRQHKQYPVLNHILRDVFKETIFF